MMKNIFKKAVDLLKIIFGYGIMITLFAGALTFFGYVIALIIGGNIASAICSFVYTQFIPIIIYASTVMILLGLLIMYLSGQTALTPSKKESSKEKTET